MCNKIIKLMKIIPKIILYTIAIILLSIALGAKVDSKVERPRSGEITIKNRAKVMAIPYGISGKIKVMNPVYKEKVTFKSNLDLNDRHE